MGNSKELTQQQENFLNKYIECGVAYQAYVFAYPKAKTWARNSVDVQANRLLNNPKINQRLAEHNKKIESTLAESITLNKRKILNEIIELQQSCKQDGAGQNSTQLQTLKLLSQIAGMLQTENKTEININNTVAVQSVSEFLDL